MASPVNKQAVKAAMQQPPVMSPEVAAQANPQGAQQQQDPLALLAQSGVDVQGLEGREQEPASPEEQNEFSRIEMAVKAIVYNSKESFNAIRNELEQGKEAPVEAISNLALTIFQTVDQKSKGGLPAKWIAKTLELSVDYVVDVAKKTGVMKVGPKIANQAMIRLVEKAGEAYGLDTSQLSSMLKENGGLPSSLRGKMKEAGVTEDEQGGKPAEGAA